MIKFDNVSKKYGDIIALSDVSFHIDEGEFVFLTGPSGAGKSTMIKLIIREITPSSGTVKIGDVDIGKLPSKKVPLLRRRVGVVFQDFKLLYDRTIFENIALALQIQGASKKEVKKEVEEILELTQLSKRANLFPAQLAGGEIQRAVIARAVVGKPDLLLADEPTGNLDPLTSSQIMNLLTTINKKGTTVLMATHNVAIVDEYSMRVLTMKGGKLAKDEKSGKYHQGKD
jgi:cell division transport system ATP-binding protein